jgi:hypothetical protein
MNTSTRSTLTSTRGTVSWASTAFRQSRLSRGRGHPSRRHSLTSRRFNIEHPQGREGSTPSTGTEFLGQTFLRRPNLDALNLPRFESNFSPEGDKFRLRIFEGDKLFRGVPERRLLDLRRYAKRARSTQARSPLTNSRRLIAKSFLNYQRTRHGISHDVNPRMPGMGTRCGTSHYRDF